MEGLATQLIDSFLKLNSMCEDFKSQVKSLPGEATWTMGLNDQQWRASVDCNQNLSDYDWAAEIYSCLDHRHDGDGRDTWQMAGLLLVPEQCIEFARDINQAKDQFGQLVHQYRALSQQKPGLDRLFQQALQHQAGTAQASRTVLKWLGASRIHIRHATRHIVWLDRYPKSISLSWIRQRRSITKISFDDCLRRLERLSRDAESTHIQQQIDTLNRVPAQQQHNLRLVQVVPYPSVKMKVYHWDGTERHMGFLSVPALVPAGTHKVLPSYTKLAPNPELAKRKRRSDNRLPDQPLLPSIRVFLSQDD